MSSNGSLYTMIVGNVGRDPEVKFVGNDSTPVCEFPVAVGRRQKKAGNWEDVTTWVKVVVFGKQAESVGKYMQKGKQVQCRGEIWLEEYTGKDGTAKTALKLNADNVLFLGSKSDGGDFAKPAAPAPAKPVPAAKHDDNDDLPF